MPTARPAGSGDADAIGHLLHEFNASAGYPTPGPAFLARRAAELIAGGEAVVLLAGDPPDGLLVLRMRPSLWADGLDAYLEELYVVPAARRRGLGRALVLAAMDLARAAGAVRMDLGTGEDDTEARALYASLGFACDGDLFYGRDL